MKDDDALARAQLLAALARLSPAQSHGLRAEAQEDFAQHLLDAGMVERTSVRGNPGVRAITREPWSDFLGFYRAKAPWAFGQATEPGALDSSGQTTSNSDQAALAQCKTASQRLDFANSRPGQYSNNSLPAKTK